MAVSSPAFSFGTSGRYVGKMTGAPGPGQYQSKIHGNKAQAPSWTLGTAKQRPPPASQGFPGPGTYTDRPKTAGPAYHMGSRYGAKEASLDPGPGAYEPKFDNSKARSTYNYPFGLKKQERAMDNFPGPGSYGAKSSMNVPSCKFGRSTRDDDIHIKSASHLPGPGAYAPHNKGATPRYGFGTATRTGMGSNMNSPGPGTYYHKEFMGKDSQKAASMRPRRPMSASQTSLMSPGPGAYAPRMSVNAPAYRIGTATRDKRKANQEPGPNHYAPGKTVRPSSPSWKIGTGQRRPLNEYNANPGPGSYQPPTKIGEGPKVGISGRHSLRASSDFPGPGMYDPNLNPSKANVPGMIIGRSVKMDERKTKEVPGPGNYNLRGYLGGPHYG